METSGVGIVRVEVLSEEWVGLDNMRFGSLAPVPEPAQFISFAVGSAILAAAARRCNDPAARPRPNPSRFETRDE